MNCQPTVGGWIDLPALVVVPSMDGRSVEILSTNGQSAWMLSMVLLVLSMELTLELLVLKGLLAVVAMLSKGE